MSTPWHRLNPVPRWAQPYVPPQQPDNPFIGPPVPQGWQWPVQPRPQFTPLLNKSHEQITGNWGKPPRTPTSYDSGDTSLTSVQQQAKREGRLIEPRSTGELLVGLAANKYNYAGGPQQWTDWKTPGVDAGPFRFDLKGAADLATSIASDPTTYIPVGAGAKAAKAVGKRVVEAGRESMPFSEQMAIKAGKPGKPKNVPEPVVSAQTGILQTLIPKGKTMLTLRQAFIAAKAKGIVKTEADFKTLLRQEADAGLIRGGAGTSSKSALNSRLGGSDIRGNISGYIERTDAPGLQQLKSPSSLSPETVAETGPSPVSPAQGVKSTPSIIAYHGSNAGDIKSFFTRQAELGGNTGASTSRLGAFFSENPDTAAIASGGFDSTTGFGRIMSGQPLSIYTTELNLKNPLNLDNLSTLQLSQLDKEFPGFATKWRDSQDKFDVVRFLAKQTGKANYPVENFATFAKRVGMTTDEMKAAWRNQTSPQFAEWERQQSSNFQAITTGIAQDKLKQLGYDGIIVNTIVDAPVGVGKQKQYIVFDPTSIRITGQKSLAEHYGITEPSAQGAPKATVETPVKTAAVPVPSPEMPPTKPPEVPPVTTAATPEPKPQPGFAGNIRLEKFDPSVRDSLKQWANTNTEAIEPARRGVQHAEDTLNKAKELVAREGGDINELVKKWKPGTAYNAEELAAINGVLQDNLKRLQELKTVIQSGKATPLDIAKMSIEQAERQQLINHLTLTRMGGSAEAGRALAWHRQLVTDIETNPNAAKIQRLVKAMGGYDKIADNADVIAQLDFNDTVAVNNFIRSINKPKAGDYLMEIYYNSILSGPKTHIINTTSNTVNALFSSVERAVSAAVEVPLARVSGRPRARLFSEVPADVLGTTEGIKDGFVAFLKTIKNGASPEQVSKFEMRRVRAFTGKPGRVINFPSTMLEAADAGMYQVNYRAALRATAKRMSGGNISKYAELVSNPSPELMAEAQRIADYRLYRREPGFLASHIMSALDWAPVGHNVKPLRFIIPFVRTPANLLEYGLERSPAGWLNPKLWQNLATKNPEAADQIARATIGSIGAAALALYVWEGNITGAAPTNPAERDRFYRDGKQPFSIRVGGKWLSYQRFEPFNQTLGLVAAAVDALKNNDKDAASKVTQAVSTITTNMASQTYMSGLSNAIDLIRQPERYSGGIGTNLATALLIPASSATRTTAQMMDRTVRQPETLGESFKANIPGLSQQVPPKIDVFGKDVVRQSPAWSPFNVTPAQETGFTQELDRLKKNIGFTGDTISAIPLTKDEQRYYQRIAGQQSERMLNELFVSPAYIRMTDEQRSRAIDLTVDEARKVARGAIFKLIPPGELERRKPQTSVITPEQRALASFPPGTGELVAQVKAMERTNPAKAKQMMYGNPSLVAARKQIALAQLSMRGG